MAWAFSSLNASPGARAFYNQQRARGLTRNDALRRLANRLVGILHGCLKTRTLAQEPTLPPLTPKLLGCPRSEHAGEASCAAGVTCRSGVPRKAGWRQPGNRHDVTSWRSGPARCHIVAVAGAVAGAAAAPRRRGGRGGRGRRAGRGARGTAAARPWLSPASTHSEGATPTRHPCRTPWRWRAGGRDSGETGGTGGTGDGAGLGIPGAGRQPDRTPGQAGTPGWAEWRGRG